MWVPSLFLKLNWFLMFCKVPGLSFLAYKTEMTALPGFTSKDRLGNAALIDKPQILGLHPDKGVWLVLIHFIYSEGWQRTVLCVVVIPQGPKATGAPLSVTWNQYLRARLTGGQGA